MKLLKIEATDLGNIFGCFIYLPNEKRFFFVNDGEQIGNRVRFYFTEDERGEEVISVAANSSVLVVSNSEE
jgi:hypothetical protein